MRPPTPSIEEENAPMNAQADYIADLLQRIATAPPDQAAALLLDAAQMHPDDARPLLLLGAEFAQAREYDRAEAAYLAAVQRAPQFAIARFQLGLLQFTSGRPAVATLTWAPLDELPEGEPLRIFKRGIECLARDAFDEARTLLEQGIAANTSNPALNRDMQMLLQRIAQQQGSAVPSEEASEETGAHFLVSAYKTLN
jgi:tetratricopeptide (TPR) repeat protein